MSDDDLDAIFKAANNVSYAAALRAVYTQGIIDATAPKVEITPQAQPEIAAPQENQSVASA